MRTLVNLSVALLYSVLALFRSREEQAIVELALRQQLAVYAHDRSRPRLSPLDRCAFSIFVLGEIVQLFAIACIAHSRIIHPPNS